MLSRNDPRVRRALDQLAETLESANSRAQEGLFSFAQTYVGPCLASVRGCLAACVEPCRACWEEEEQRRRRLQQAARGRAELSFDFYDDWEAEEADPLLGGDEAEEEEPATAAVSGGTVREGGGSWLRGRARERTMSYGAVPGGSGKSGGGKGKQLMAPPDEDAPIIRSSSYFGFLESLPFRLGAKGLRYQPSIADLQDHPGSRRRLYSEEQSLPNDSDADEEMVIEAGKRKRPAQLPAMRKRSGTQGSGHTTDSFSSRGDIFPSEDEMDDAVPLDDEFALHLERRTTGSGSGGGAEDRSSGSSARNRSASSRASLLSAGSRRGAPPENRILSPASLFGPEDVPAERRKRVPQRSRSSPELDNVSSAQASPYQASKSLSHSPLLNGFADAIAKPPIVMQLPPPVVESPPAPAVESKHPQDTSPLPPPAVASSHTPNDPEPSQADQRWVAAALPNFSRSPT
jgi:hypothetical protein